ncbi:hypothetical protein ScPMuIL_006782 [Solemya velum]
MDTEQTTSESAGEQQNENVSQNAVAEDDSGNVTTGAAEQGEETKETPPETQEENTEQPGQPDTEEQETVAIDTEQAKSESAGEQQNENVNQNAVAGDDPAEVTTGAAQQGEETNESPPETQEENTEQPGQPDTEEQEAVAIDTEQAKSESAGEQQNENVNQNAVAGDDPAEVTTGAAQQGEETNETPPETQEENTEQPGQPDTEEQEAVSQPQVQEAQPEPTAEAEEEKKAAEVTPDSEAAVSEQKVDVAEEKTEGDNAGGETEKVQEEQTSDEKTRESPTQEAEALEQEESQPLPKEEDQALPPEDNQTSPVPDTSQTPEERMRSTSSDHVEESLPLELTETVVTLAETEETTIPDPPRLPTPEQTETLFDTNVTKSALNMVWSFGLNRNVPVLNMTDDTRKMILYPCAHAGVLYDFKNNRQYILQGHSNPITCSCVSEDKRWLATGDKGRDSMVVVWDTYTGIPVQTLFDPTPDGGVVALAMTPDARYLATLSSNRTSLPLRFILSIWDWTMDGEVPVCSAELSPTYGVQNFICFNPDDFHFIATNSDSQVVFYSWGENCMDYFAPPLTDQDFNKPVGRYSQTIFQRGSTRALTATSIGNLVVWDKHKPINRAIKKENAADKKALKIIRLQERGINVLTITEKYIVVGDTAGHVKFFDQNLKLVHWYQNFHIGPITSVSFAHSANFKAVALDGTNFPPDATIQGRQFVIRDFVIGSSLAMFGSITADGTTVKVIHKEHDAAIHALEAHPVMPYLIVGSYSGLLKIWNYEKKQVMVSRTFDKGSLIRCCSYDPQGAHIAVGMVNGCVHILDALTLEDEMEPFRYSRDAITHLAFSHDSQFFATGDAEHAVTVFRKQHGSDTEPYFYLGRYRAHYKTIREITFGVQLDSSFPRLLSLGEDRLWYVVEYDLENSDQDNLRLLSSDRIEQSGVPLSMAWYPPITKEHFIITTNDQYKFKLFNTTTKMCRKTLLGPAYGSPIQKIKVLPTEDPVNDSRYLAYVTADKIGLQILPVDGNPHKAMALIAHPGGVANMTYSHDGKYLFTAGGSDASVHMWEINLSCLEAQATLGGEELVPFYGLLDGGRNGEDGELFAELEDYFYYAQIRSQGVNAMEKREASTKIPLSEVPFVMRAMGFYPSEQEIEDMMNEIKFSRYVDDGHYVEEIDLGDFIKLYINHRPAFGLSPEKIKWAFDVLGLPTNDGNAIERGDMLDMLQSKGEHMTEYELAEYLTTLLGFNAEGGSSELQDFDASVVGDVIDKNLPHHITSEMFSNEVLGFSMYTDILADDQPEVK